MASPGEIPEHWIEENDYFKIEPPTVLGIKEACFAARRDSQKAFRLGFEAGVKYLIRKAGTETPNV